MTNIISQLEMTACCSSLYKIEFILVYPPEHSPTPTVVDALANAYIAHELAIKPEVPVVLIQLASLHDAGTKIYGGNPNCPAIYHLPPDSYDDLEDIISEGIFCVSPGYLSHVIESNALNKSIFGVLGPLRQSKGLNVIGIHHEIAEA